MFSPHQEAHKNESTKVSISTRITIPLLNSSWRKKSITLVLAMGAHDAALASFMTVKSHFESIMVSPTHPPVPASVALRRLPKDTSNISSTRTNDKNSEKEAYWSYLIGIYSTEEAERTFSIVPLVPDLLAPDKEVSILCRRKPGNNAKSDWAFICCWEAELLDQTIIEPSFQS